MYYLGTSGFSYEDWAGLFYPLGLEKREWLAYYAREFNTTEVNSTYYAIPSPSTFRAMARKTGPGFLFSVKANREMTHQRGENEEVFLRFRRCLEPLLEEGKLGCVLSQFPSSFRPSPENWAYLERLPRWLGGLPLVIEFRHGDWLTPETFSWLREGGIGFCCVDEPRLLSLMPPVAEATASLAYVRFHGRNAKKWWHHKEAWERYDYTYSRGELEEWAPKIKGLAEKTEKVFVYANNHWRGQAVDTIRQLRPMLD